VAGRGAELQGGSGEIGDEQIGRPVNALSLGLRPFFILMRPSLVDGAGGGK
jgi:hypothetical protein